MRELPKAAWEAYLRNRNAAALLAIVEKLPERPPPDADYPEFHRICDVELEGQAYRICRLFDLDVGQERLFIDPTDVPAFEKEGVYYWLDGKSLGHFVRGECEYPAKDDIDWDIYRST